MRIASLVPQGIVNAIYRSLVPMQALAHRGHLVRVDECSEVRDAALLREADVVHFMRFCEPPMQQLARHLREAGVALVWDNDDDLSSPVRGSRGHRERRGLHGQEVKRGIEKMVMLADVVTTPSAELGDRYRDAGAVDVRVLENHLPPTFLGQPGGRDRNRVMIGWVAAGEHRHDAAQLHLRETLERLLERRPDVQVASVGVNLGLRSDRYHHIANVPYGELPGFIGEFDVALAPIIDNAFNRSRSNVKLKEYAAIGVPWLASPIGPYADMSDQHGGRLVGDDGWDEALEALVADPGERMRLGRQGLRWARGQTIECHVELWEQALLAAVERARSRAQNSSADARR